MFIFKCVFNRGTELTLFRSRVSEYSRGSNITEDNFNIDGSEGNAENEHNAEIQIQQDRELVNAFANPSFRNIL